MTERMSNRIQRLRQELGERGLDGVLISQPENRRYLSGFCGSAGWLLITAEEAVLATDFRYTEQARREDPAGEVIEVSADMADWLPKLAADLNINTMGFEAEHVTFAIYRRLTGVLDRAKSGLRLEATDGLVESLRAVKEPEEIALISRAVEMADRALAHAQGIIRAGISEAELAREIEGFLREQGSEALPFEVIVAAGYNSALPHARPSAHAISPGEPVVIDIGARCGGYCSDLSRTIWTGAPGDSLKKVYDIVLGAQLTALAIMKEGMTGSEADSLARAVIEEAGYGSAFGHGLGHGVGLAAHEMPRLGKGSEDRLVDGMVFTVEPGIYLAGWGGVRIEDMAVMEGGKPRVISKAGKGVL